MSHRSLIVLPDDTGKPIIDAINAATKTIRIKMFVYSDPDLIKAVIAAKGRGVKIQVMLNPARRDGEEVNAETRKTLEQAGINVKDSSPDFGITHEKSMVVDDVGIKIHKLKHLKLHGKMLLADGSRAIVGSINLAPGSFDDRRELAIEVHDEEIVERLHKVAKQDWENSHPLDLTDEGLSADLEDRKEGSSENLALDVDEKAVKHHKK